MNLQPIFRANKQKYLNVLYAMYADENKIDEKQARI